MDPGTLIAIDVCLIYSILGPLVLLGIYTIFHCIGGEHKALPSPEAAEKKPIDAALWNRFDLKYFRYFR